MVQKLEILFVNLEFVSKDPEKREQAQSTASRLAIIVFLLSLCKIFNKFLLCPFIISEKFEGPLMATSWY